MKTNWNSNNGNNFILAATKMFHVLRWIQRYTNNSEKKQRMKEIFNLFGSTNDVEQRLNWYKCRNQQMYSIAMKKGKKVIGDGITIIRYPTPEFLKTKTF